MLDSRQHKDSIDTNQYSLQPFLSADWEPKITRETWKTALHANSYLIPLKGPTVPDWGRHFFLAQHYRAEGDTCIIKRGAGDDEGAMTELARHVLNGIITVPTVHAIIELPGSRTAMVSDYIQPTVPLSTIWAQLTSSQRATIKRQLCDILLAMRRPSFKYAGRPGHKPYMLPHGFGVVAEAFCDGLHDWNASRARAIKRNVPDTALAKRLCQAQYTMAATDRFVLTHGDLSDRNILVDPATLTIASIVDWERANVVPSYFEYVAAWLCLGHDQHWRMVLLDVLRMVLEEEVGSKNKAQELERWKTLLNIESYARFGVAGPDESFFLLSHGHDVA